MRLSSSLPQGSLALALAFFAIEAIAPSDALAQVSEKERPSIAGVLVGTDGRPLDGVELTLHGRGCWRNAGGRARRLDTSRKVRLVQPLKTDGKGQFALTHSLDPGREYSLRWSGDGVEPGVSGWLTPNDLGAELRLSAVARRPFFGRLLDQRGQPMADAEVRTRDQGQAVTTNDRGEFRLPFVSELREPLVVHHPDGAFDWAFDWALVSGGDSWTDVVTEHETPTSRVRQSLPTGTALEDLESDLRARSLEVAIRNGSYIDFRWRLLDLAEVNLAAALERLERPEIAAWFESVTPRHFHDRSTCGCRVYYETGLRKGANLREYVGAQLRLAADPSDEQARSDYEAFTTEPPQGSLLGSRLGYGLRTILQRDRPSGKKLTPIEQARRDIAEAASLVPYRQVATYADAAVKLLESGLDEEAAEAMAKANAIVAPGETPKFLSDGYIHALCRFDLDAGLELIRAEKKDRYERLMTQAIRLAAESSDRAISLLHEAEKIPVPRYRSFRSRTRVQRFVYALSSTDPATAEGLARRYDSTGYSLGLVALYLARNAGPADAKKTRRRVQRLLNAAYRIAGEATDPRRRSDAAVSLLAIASEADPLALRTWLGHTLWESTPRQSLGDSEGLIAWTMRDFAPELAESLAFSALRRTECENFPFNEAWSIAASFDLARTADRASHERGRGLEETAAALSRDPLGPYGTYGPTTAGCWWPKE